MKRADDFEARAAALEGALAGVADVAERRNLIFCVLAAVYCQGLRAGAEGRALAEDIIRGEK